MLHLRHEQEAAALLNLPANLALAMLLPIAYYIGDDFKPTAQQPLVEHVHWNGWQRQRGE